MEKWLTPKEHPSIRVPQTIPDMLSTLHRIFEYGRSAQVSTGYIVGYGKYYQTDEDVAFFDNAGGNVIDAFWGKTASAVIKHLRKERPQLLYAYRLGGIGVLRRYPVYGTNTGWISWVDANAKDPRFTLEATQFVDKEKP